MTGKAYNVLEIVCNVTDNSWDAGVAPPLLHCVCLLAMYRGVTSLRLVGSVAVNCQCSHKHVSDPHGLCSKHGARPDSTENRYSGNSEKTKSL